MTRTETVQALLAAVEQRQWATAKTYLTDDFTFGGAMPQPISADAWLAVHEGLESAMLDFAFNARNIRESGDQVLMEVAITGTQTRELKLPIPGIPVVAPTGKRVQLPAEPCACAFRGDKIASYTVSEVPGGGVMGILGQLGAPIPSH